MSLMASKHHSVRHTLMQTETDIIAIKPPWRGAGLRGYNDMQMNGSFHQVGGGMGRAVEIMAA